MDEIAISIIVPVYRVEKELPRCLDSLIAQNYSAKEILLIDDGSPDRCGAICDEYAAKHPNIRVIHQANQGLAAVRNTGIREARGEFISFIDSDDYVLDGLYAHAAKLIRRYEADILCFGHVDVYRPGQAVPPPDEEEVISRFTASEAIDQLFFDNHIDVITCNKIIRRSLFDGIAFPVGKLYEDMFTTYKYASRARRIVSTSRRYYVYCHRPESIGAQRFSEKTMDLARATQEVYDFGRSFCEETPNLNAGYLYWMIVVANIMIRSGHADRAYMQKVRALSVRFRKDVWNCGLLSQTRKAQLILFGVNLPLYKLLYRWYVKRHRFSGKDAAHAP